MYPWDCHILTGSILKMLLFCFFFFRLFQNILACSPLGLVQCNVIKFVVVLKLICDRISVENIGFFIMFFLFVEKKKFFFFSEMWNKRKSYCWFLQMEINGDYISRFRTRFIVIFFIFFSSKSNVVCDVQMFQSSGSSPFGSYVPLKIFKYFRGPL